MSLADDLFINMCKDIIDNGYSTEGEKVRPKWEDGTYAYTIKRFGVVNRYDLSKEFPAITLRKTYVKSAIDELLWIWQKKSNNVYDLKSHIWDSWADENGSIGKAYGYQLGVKHKYKEGMMDQVDRLIYDLKNNPYSRRMLTNIYVHQDLSEMNLYPCAYSMTFNVTGDRLNAILNQRSQDVLAANNWNVVQTRIATLKKYEEMEQDGTFDVLPKKEVIQIKKEMEKLEKNLGGIKNMKRIPDMIFVVDPKKERICIQEAQSLGIKLVGIADTNCDPEELDYVIPGNDDAIRAVKLIVSKMADAVIEAQQGVDADSVDEAEAEEAAEE